MASENDSLDDKTEIVAETPAANESAAKVEESENATAETQPEVQSTNYQVSFVTENGATVVSDSADTENDFHDFNVPSGYVTLDGLSSVDRKSVV